MPKNAVFDPDGVSRVNFNIKIDDSIHVELNNPGKVQALTNDVIAFVNIVDQQTVGSIPAYQTKGFRCAAAQKHLEAGLPLFLLASGWNNVSSRMEIDEEQTVLIHLKNHCDLLAKSASGYLSH
jgi:hypothetical protein